MIELFSTQFWIATLFIFQFLFVVYLFFLVKKINRLKSTSNRDQMSELSETVSQIASTKADSVIQMLEPILREGRRTALTFDEQIKEKKRLIKELNDALDNRIINMNLLLSRAEVQQKKMLERQHDNPFTPRQISPPDMSQNQDMGFDQQNQIIDMYDQQFDIDTIAQKLSIPIGEVRMVIDLKKKFLEMEQHNP